MLLQRDIIVISPDPEDARRALRERF